MRFSIRDNMRDRARQLITNSMDVSMKHNGIIGGQGSIGVESAAKALMKSRKGTNDKQKRHDKLMERTCYKRIQFRQRGIAAEQVSSGNTILVMTHKCGVDVNEST